MFLPLSRLDYPQDLQSPKQYPDQVHFSLLERAFPAGLSIMLTASDPSLVSLLIQTDTTSDWSS